MCTAGVLETSKNLRSHTRKYVGKRFQKLIFHVYATRKFTAILRHAA
jgi:hypothetical protein